MNDEQYLAALKRALSGLDRGAREEILREIASHAEETEQTDSLEERFGSVEDLAEQYLEGEVLATPITGRIAKLGKTAVLIVGSFTLLLVALVVVLAWLYSGDQFNYADEAVIHQEINAEEWASVAWNGPLELEIDQAHAVLYWQDQDQLRWYCRGRQDIDPAPGARIKIRHGFCVLYLPIQQSNVQANQSGVVLVRPKASVMLDLNQANLRIAENSVNYRYEFELQNSNAAPFESDETAPIVITIAANESSVSAYEYE